MQCFSLMTIYILGQMPVLHYYIIPHMSSSTPDLISSDKKRDRFFNRNDLFIYLNNEVFFGECSVLSFANLEPLTDIRLPNWTQCYLGEYIQLHEHGHRSRVRLQLCCSTERPSRRCIHQLGSTIEGTFRPL
jgi:hypothetical protein